MTLKSLRTEKGLTQADCSRYLQIPLRTYKRYEAEETRESSVKYRYMVDRLMAYGIVDEEHGLLTIEQIKNVCENVLPAYDAEYCYLFGSYAKGVATETSDVDLLVSVPLNGLRFYELAEMLRENLNKKVDLLDETQLHNNPELLHEILKDGIKVFG
ncbi:MAG: nucleotidyltransferase domain-containing protein [Clostridia bacterium]|nr:nucleotidyltransferase domain-containing protein [Clostridia bacterium]